MLKLAVVGKDVSRSQSPQIHAFILSRMGSECEYQTVSISPEQFSSQVQSLFSKYDAFNVTIPFKGEIIPYLQKVCGDADVFGAVNTVTCKNRYGYNTDGFGFLLMLTNAGVQLNGKTALVLGAGGAGRSCIKKLLDAGAEVFAFERDKARLLAVHDEFGAFTPLFEVPMRSFDLIVNCTGIGMHNTEGQTPTVTWEGGEVSPVDERILSRCECAVDLIYVPEQSEFLRIAASCGKQTVNGGAMLFYQAYMADCIYLGKEPSDEEAKKLWEEYRGEKI